jgi:hypothetical protein
MTPSIMQDKRECYATGSSTASIWYNGKDG